MIPVIIDQFDPKTGQRPLIPDHYFLATNSPVEQKRAAELLEHYRCHNLLAPELQNRVLWLLSGALAAQFSATGGVGFSSVTRIDMVILRQAFQAFATPDYPHSLCA